jgi:hypothetical protein
MDSVGVVEISGSGISSLDSSVEETKRAIDEEGVGFLGGATLKRSATEAYLSATRATATLNGFARAKQQAIRALVLDWCEFTGEDGSAFSVAVDQSVLEMPLDSGEMGQLLSIWQAQGIDHQTFLELLRLGRQLPPSIDIDEILERVESEKAAAIPEPASLQNGMIGMDMPEPLEVEMPE